MPFTVLIPQPSSLLVRIHRSLGLDWKEANSCIQPWISLTLTSLLFCVAIGSCLPKSWAVSPPFARQQPVLVTEAVPPMPCLSAVWKSIGHNFPDETAEEQSRQLLHEGIGNWNSLLDKQEHPSLIHTFLLHLLKFLKVKRGKAHFWVNVFFNNFLWSTC